MKLSILNKINQPKIGSRITMRDRKNSARSLKQKSPDQAPKLAYHSSSTTALLEHIDKLTQAKNHYRSKSITGNSKN